MSEKIVELLTRIVEQNDEIISELKAFNERNERLSKSTLNHGGQADQLIKQAMQMLAGLGVQHGK